MFCKSLLKVMISFTINSDFAVTKSAEPNLENQGKV